MGEDGRFVSSPKEAKVKSSLSSIPIDNSLGLDDFGSSFYLACCDLVKADNLLDVATYFLNGADRSRFFTSSYIVLISKVNELNSFHKFRPICLCSVAYKFFFQDCRKQVDGKPK